MIKVELGFSMSELKKFDVLEKDYKVAVFKAVKKAMTFVEGESKKRFNTPGNLNVLTGTLRRSIRSEVEKEINKVTGAIFTDVIYGPVHELGLLMRTRSGSTYHMPQRAFLEPAISENLDRIVEIIANDVIKTLER